MVRKVTDTAKERDGTVAKVAKVAKVRQLAGFGCCCCIFWDMCVVVFVFVYS